MQLEEVPQPVPGRKEVLIRVKAIGINPVDAKVRAGTNRIAKNLALPAIIGWDVSGVVVACGSGVQKWKEGDAVFGCIGFPGAGGGYATHALAAEGSLVAKPGDLSFEAAAALPIAGLTAYQSIHQHLNVQPGQRVLIQAAAGGVGHLAVQFAKHKDAVVIATASAKNHAFLQSLGADELIDYHTTPFENAAPVDAVQDAMGGTVLHRSIACTRPGGAVVCLPSSTKDDPEALRLARERNVRLQWPMMVASAPQLELLADLARSGMLQVHIETVFPFGAIADAHRAIESGRTRGKLVVRLPD